ncbi:MAG: ABC-type uncharacterized transport system, ATPase component [Anaerocolumna sp.]|nr:ABC-type uncharacterized transport system, ATPase component [Anaerocolumna sp.]
MIEVTNLKKSFMVARRNAGFGQAVKSLFHKKYEEVKALDDISFTIKDGEMVGYIGPNGAGKSSTIKVLSGILNPDDGKCVINGRVPWKDRIDHVKEIGVVFGQRSQLWWDVPVIDSFELLRDIYKVPQNKYKSNLDELVTLLNLEEIIRTPARQLSLGQRMRCEIAASLLHNPQILFLDEPTIGLDAVSKIAVRNFILQMNENHKTTVILTTHDMQDIETLTKRIVLIGKGKILLDGSIEEMKKQFGNSKQIVLDYGGERLKLSDGMRLISNVISKDETKETKFTGHAIIEVDTVHLDVSKAIGLLSEQVEVKDISVTGAKIDDVVVNLYKQYEI